MSERNIAVNDCRFVAVKSSADAATLPLLLLRSTRMGTRREWFCHDTGAAAGWRPMKNAGHVVQQLRRYQA